MSEKTSSQIISPMDVYSIDEFINNKDLITAFAQIVMTDNHMDISSIMRNMLLSHIKKVGKDTIYRLNNDNKLWQPKEKSILETEIGNIFNLILKNYLSMIEKPTEEEKKQSQALLKYTRSSSIKQLISLTLNALTPNDEDGFLENLNASPYELPLKKRKIVNLKHNVVRTRGNPAELLPLIGNDMKKYKPFEKESDFFTFEIDAEIVKDLKLPQEFFESLMCGDKVKTKYLQQILGSCLINGNPSQSFFIFTGEGSNGKSTMIKILDYFLGKVSTSIDPNLIIENANNKYSSSSSANPMITNLRNKRFIFLSETKNNDKLKEDFLKKITGDDKIPCRDLYSNEVQEFVISATPILISNYKPTFDITKKAMLRRFKHIEFNAKFVSKPTKKGEYLGNPQFWEDVFLPNKDAFFSWIVEGAYSFLNENIKLEPPEEIKKDIEAYIGEIDIVSNFVSEKLIFTNDNKDRISKPDMFENFKTYCDDVGKPYKQKKDFYAEMDKICKPKQDHGHEKYYGYQFRFDDDEEEIKEQI